MSVAIITGASSGLGREYLHQLSQTEQFEEIWAIARRQDRLQELVVTYGDKIRPLALDLTKAEDLNKIATLLQKEKPNVGMLINAAGFGKMGPTTAISASVYDAMIDLNCRAAVDMTALAIPYMQKGAHILEICSSAGFAPIPQLNVYAATKAFLLNYSKALHYELKEQGILVTAVCPYWVKDTEFIPHALAGTAQAGRHFIMATKAVDVVRLSLADSRNGCWVSTPGLMCTLHRFLAWFIPNKLMLFLTDWWHKL
jgi:short-subunit dehydrogenase